MASLRAFVIMPFDEEFDAVYAELIVPPLVDAGFEVRRADDVDTRQNVMVDVVRGIAEADLVVADLTTANPNVFYELGLAHALGVPTILITQEESAEDIPFDLRQYRTEFYDTHFSRARAIVDVLGRIGRSHAEGEIPFGSPVSDFLPGAPKPARRDVRSGPVALAQPGTSALRERDGERPPTAVPGVPAEEEDEGGLLDYLDALSEGSDEIVGAMEPLSEATIQVGEQFERLAGTLGTLDPTAPGAQSQGRRLMLQAAHLLSAYAAEMEDGQAKLEQAVDKVTANGLGYLTLLAARPEPFREHLADTLKVSTELRASVEEGTEGVKEFRDTVAAMPPMIKELNRARTRAVRALDAVLAQFDRVRSYAEQSAGLAESALGSVDPSDDVDDPTGSAPPS